MPEEIKATLDPRDDGPYLRKPKNTIARRLFVAATRQNDGKTTTCLGLFGALQSHFKSVGYIKPVGQRFISIAGLKIDEDSYLLDSIYDVQVPIEAMSPIAIDPTFTRRYLKNPEEQLEVIIDKMCRAFDRTSYHKDAVIIEGSGHAGVGSVFDMSNAHVAKVLRAKAVIVSQGGIGRPIDEIALNKALFDKFGVPVIGAILNKVHPDKIDIVTEYARLGLERHGVPLLGVLPTEKQLAAPNLSQVVEVVNGRWLNGRDRSAHERILNVVVGAMTAKGVIDYLEPGVLIISPGDRDDIILAAIAAAGQSSDKVVSGIILTRNMLPHPKLMDLLAKTNIPVAICSQESYTVASKITSMTVKTQPQDTDKIPLIKKMVTDNLDLASLVASM